MEGIPWRQSNPRQRHTALLHQSPLRHILRRRASPCRCRPWRKTPITQSVAALRALSRGCGLGGAGREVRRPWLKRTANLHHVSHKGTLQGAGARAGHGCRSTGLRSKTRSRRQWSAQRTATGVAPAETTLGEMREMRKAPSNAGGNWTRLVRRKVPNWHDLIRPFHLRKSVHFVTLDEASTDRIGSVHEHDRDSISAKNFISRCTAQVWCLRQFLGPNYVLSHPDSVVFHLRLRGGMVSRCKCCCHCRASPRSRRRCAGHRLRWI